MFKLYKKNLLLLFFIFFLVDVGHSQSSDITLAVEKVNGQVIPKKSYELFFEFVLLGDKFKRPVLESFDSGGKPLDLKNAIKKFHKDTKQDHQKALKGLGKILKIFNITDRKTLERILLNFYKEVPFEQREDIQNKWRSENLQSRKIAENYFFNFIHAIEDRYVIGDVNSSKRQSINLFYELLESESVGKKEIRLLRKILSKLGLPAQAHHDEFLRLYLLEIKERQVQADKEGDFQRRVTDQDVLNLVERTKVYFDDYHFNNLKEMTRFKNIIKGFPVQYILFQAAIGSMIYREHVTDPLLYDAHTKPGYIQEFMSQSLTPSSMVSFFIFIVVSQKTNYLFYKTGRHFDKKFLKTMAPHMGLASGFFISALATELYQDVDFRECVSSLGSKQAREDEQDKHISHCEKSYAKWIQSKWSDYAVDIITLLGASWISHKIVQTVLMGIRATSTGGAWLYGLSTKLGPRISVGVGFFITIYLFMESHYWLEKYIGKPVKNYIKVNRIQSELFALEHNLDSMKNSKQVLSNVSEESVRLKEKVIQKIKIMGRQFNDWFLLKVQDYQWSFSLWLKKTNKMTLFYQQSRELLANLYNQSVNSYDFRAEFVSQGKRPTNKGFLIDKDIFDENREYYYKVICSNRFIQDIENTEIKIWKRFCDKNISLSDEDLMILAYETTIIISELLGVLQSQIDFSPYLGKKPEELFSSDTSYSLNSLSPTEKINLIKSLLKDVHHSEDFIRKIWLENKNDYVKNCLEKYHSSKEEADICINNSYQNLQHKVLAAAIYLLKKQFINPYTLLHISNGTAVPSTSLLQTSLLNSIGVEKFEKIESLLEFLKVYKKGEIFFDFQLGNYELFRKEIIKIGDEDEVKKIKDYPYLFFQNIICGSQNDSSEDYFIPPLLFEDLSYLCDRVYSGVKNPKLFHEVLFSKPIEVESKKYANLWLFLEHYIRDHFKSKEDLLEFFEEKSAKKIEQFSFKYLEELNHLNQNYLFPNMINRETVHLKTCQEIMDHYSKENLRSIDLKGLEVSLFQVIYWLNQLEKRYEVLSSKCEIIELLKEYHDSYTKSSGPYIHILQDEEFNVSVEENGLRRIKEFYPDANTPVLVRASMILSTILKESPSYSKDNFFFVGFTLSILQMNMKSPKKYDEIEYALLFELKSSLDNFFQQLNLLRIKENVGEQLNPLRIKENG